MDEFSSEIEIAMQNNATSENAGWKGDEPTEAVKKAFEEGIIKPGNSVLDIGCGFGRNSNGLAELGVNVTAININDNELDHAREKAKSANLNVNYIHADATLLPFAEKTFDVALDLGCSHMIPTIEGQEKAAHEASRVVKPGGYLIYFGFSKDHPAYKNKPDSPMFRNIEDINDLYGNDFEIISQEVNRWRPKPEENANFDEHVGINVILKRK